MINTDDYTGYYDYAGRFVKCTGSVRDYFRDNSMGQFQPQFDIVGPVQIDRSQFYPKSTDNASQLTLDVVNAIDNEVNFALYDGDKDGMVDMIFFIFAGHGANVGGNDSRLLWPHASAIYDPSTYQYVNKDGVWLGRYACSTELTGSQSGREMDGIGTICHEFSHVLGLPDFYDTDYAGSGGESKDPGNWSLMSAGCYLNGAHTPSGYSLFERYMVGFAMPEVIKEERSYSLERLNVSNTGYRINTPVNKEYFILENRQQEKWDTYLPGHGLLVFRVDSTNTRVWDNNTINCNPNHNYYELVRARGSKSNVAGSYDPYPGRGKVTTLNSSTSPANLKTWSGKETKYGLLNITEENGVISFDIENTYILRELSLPETFTLGSGLYAQLPVTPVPDYAIFNLTWKSADENIVMVDENGMLFGILPGETTVTVESDNGLTASCLVQVIDVPETSDIATFKTFVDMDNAVLNLTNAQVVLAYEKTKDLYVRDATGAIVLRKAEINAKQGDLLNGKLLGKMSYDDHQMPQLLAVEDFTDYSAVTVSEGPELLPTRLTVAELSPEHYADYLLLENVTLEHSGSGYFLVNDEGTQLAQLYNYFQVPKIKMPKNVEGKTFNVKGLYNARAKGFNTAIFLDLFENPEENVTEVIHDLQLSNSTHTTIYDITGRQIVNSQIVNGQIVNGALPKGVYILNGTRVVIK